VKPRIHARFSGMSSAAWQASNFVTQESDMSPLAAHPNLQISSQKRGICKLLARQERYLRRDGSLEKGLVRLPWLIIVEVKVMAALSRRRVNRGGRHGQTHSGLICYLHPPYEATILLLLDKLIILPCFHLPGETVAQWRIARFQDKEVVSLEDVQELLLDRFPTPS